MNSEDPESDIEQNDDNDYVYEDDFESTGTCMSV